MDLDSGSGECHVDSAQMKQAFLNILMNAIDAMPNGGTLTVSVVRHSEAKPKNPTERDPSPVSGGLRMTAITISDTGCGIPKDKIGHIFDPFYTNKEQGTGLGLAITHSIIEKNRGKIEVQSQEGIGTSFRIFLPTS